MFLLAACTPDPKDADDTGTPDTGGETGETVEGELALRLSETIATVVIVNWNATGDAGDVTIEYGADTSYGLTAPAVSDGEGVLLGLDADQEVHVRLAVTRDGETTYTGDHVLTTGSLPSGLLAGEVETEVDSGAGDDFGTFLLTSWFNVGNGSSGVGVLTRQGTLVWYWEEDAGMILAARPKPDGTGLRYLWEESPVETDASRICEVDWSGEASACVDTPGAHHDFRELADGTLYYPKQEVDTWGGWDLVGDALTMRTTDGVESTVWSTFANVEPIETADWDRLQTPDGVDWTHLNGMWHDEAEDAWYLSFLHFQSVFKVVDGETAWALGGDYGEFTFDGTAFGPQHAPMYTGGELWLYDNAGVHSDTSRVASFRLDGRTATETRSWPHPGGDRSATLGDANVHDNGYVASSFGEVGEIVVWTAEGDVAWRYAANNGTVLVQTYLYDDLYLWGAG